MYTHTFLRRTRGINRFPFLSKFDLHVHGFPAFLRSSIGNNGGEDDCRDWQHMSINRTSTGAASKLWCLCGGARAACRACAACSGGGH